MELTVSGVTYKLKFGYRAVAQDCVLNKVSNIQDIIQSMGGDNTYDSISKILEILAEVINTGLSEYDMSLVDTYDLLEKYFDENKENEDISVFTLYGDILKELLGNGFLVRMFPKEMTEIIEKETKKATKKAATKN